MSKIFLNELLITVLNVIIHTISAQIPDVYDNLEYNTMRPLPPELASMFEEYKLVTTTENAMLDCMIDFTKCVSSIGDNPVCAMNEKGNEKVFNNLCEMEYENCKTDRLITESVAEYYINETHTRPWKVRFYPKDSMFRKADLIDRGCTVFVKDCPHVYKQNVVCARHYDGQYKTFNNYCEMEFENCNSWRKWSLIKHERC